MLKAGNAGSIPDGDATTQPNAASIALSHLLDEIGEAVFSLNTIVVGLDAVENGYEKPESLDISWAPRDRKSAARKSRKFALEAVLISSSEGLNQFVISLSRLPRFSSMLERWSTAKPNPSIAEKLVELSSAVLGQDNYHICAAALLVHWRNRIVHQSSSAKLTQMQKQILRKNEVEVATRYKNLSVDCLLCHFEEGRPTLKDVSSLISMSINLAREIDRKIYESITKEDVDAWLEYYEIAPVLKKVKAESKPSKLGDSMRRVFQTHAPQLLGSYEKFYGSLT